MKRLCYRLAAIIVFLGVGFAASAQVTAPLNVKHRFKKMPEQAAESNREGIRVEAYAADHWYKGNTHCHSDTAGERIFAHGDGPPEATLKWYADHGYDFVALTDHNYMHQDLAAPHGILYIKSEEITQYQYHVNALGVQTYIRPQFGGKKVDIYQHAIDLTLEQGGLPVLNHPTTPLGYAFPANIESLENLHHMEVYNMQPGNYNRLGEPLWDRLLTDGYVIYGLITDDGHMFASEDPFFGDPPGGGWIMVDADELTQESILDAMRKGRFYSSTGVAVKQYEVSKDGIEIWLSPVSTFNIEFIGPFGEVLACRTGDHAAYQVDGDELYVRVRVTDPDGKLALMQPVFYK